MNKNKKISVNVTCSNALLMMLVAVPTILCAVTSFNDAGIAGDVLAVDVITIINKKPESYLLLSLCYIKCIKSQYSNKSSLINPIQPVFLSRTSANNIFHQRNFFSSLNL